VIGRTGKRVINYWPNRNAEESIRQEVREIVNFNRTVKVGEVIRELNPIVRGWVNYYRIGNSSKKFGNIRYYIVNRVRKYMRKRRHLSGYGFKEYPDKYIYQVLGLYNDYQIRWAKTFK
jgi:RNA-directed DNA polymerase